MPACAPATHAQLRPLDPFEWRMFEGGRAVSAPVGAGWLADQRASLAGTEGTLVEAGNFRAFWRTGRVVLEAGGTVRGVIPQVLIDWEHQHENISELLVVEDMHVRKRKLYELCDGAVILPGGFGTLDELFEILTWNQLAIHDKKIFIMNSGGFYNHLLAHMIHLEKEEFLYGKLEEVFTVLNHPKELRSYFTAG